jgi:hypothetical protein
VVVFANKRTRGLFCNEIVSLSLTVKSKYLVVSWGIGVGVVCENALGIDIDLEMKVSWRILKFRLVTLN